MNYCPRCDALTVWTNKAAPPGQRFGCSACELEESDLMTEDELVRYRAHLREVT